MSAVTTTPARTAAEAVALPRSLTRLLALPFLFVAATAYHFLQSRGHATPTVFNDELLYAKLSQSLAAGHGLGDSRRALLLPAPLAPLVQAPAWLLGSMTDAYAVAKLLNAAVMSAVVFPAYWIARRLVRPSFALLTAAAAVATPAMVYHGYLMSEALAYPVFLCALAVILRGVEKPGVAVPLVCVLAVATRVQFLVLPLAYLAAVAVCGRGDYRRHLVAGDADCAVRRGAGPGSGRARTVRRGDAHRTRSRRSCALGADDRLSAPVLVGARDRSRGNPRAGCCCGGSAFEPLVTVRRARRCSSRRQR